VQIINNKHFWRQWSNWQIEGERGGTAFPFRFSRGNAVPLAQVALMGGLAENGRLTSECWTQYQLIEKTKTSPWLIVRNRKLSCKTCRNVKNIKSQQSTDRRNSFVVRLD